jgi:hypothetical protein
MPEIKDFSKRPPSSRGISLLKLVLAVEICAAGSLSAAAEGEPYEWYFHDFDRQGFAEAAFGNPESDERLIRFTCSNGVLEVQGPLATAWSRADDAIGTSLRISFTMSEGQRQVIDAEIADAGDGLNYGGKIAANSPIIAALIAGKNVRIQRVNFRQAFEVPGRGAARPMRSLLQACTAQKTKRP